MAGVIREGDQYSGVRVSLAAGLHTARLTVKVDGNVGDPIWPVSEDVTLPRLLSDEPLILRGYPLHMVLAERLVTATDRGVANTRWRDVADIYLLSRHHPVDGDGSVLAVPRDAAAVDLDVAKGIGEPRWGAGRVTQHAGASGEIGLLGSALTQQVGNCEVHADDVPADGARVDLRFGRAQGRPTVGGEAAHKGCWSPRHGAAARPDRDVRAAGDHARARRRLTATSGGGGIRYA